MGRRPLIVLSLVAASGALAATPAVACGGLIGPGGAVNLVRTTTFAGYHQGVEHYVTAFTFTGQGGGAFGSIVPLPGVPTKVERGGDWTLQRLEREVQPVFVELTSASAPGAGVSAPQIILETKIDALDITVLKGGGREVGAWAKRNGFDLSPDAPEVLDFYARRSPIFMAARFDAAEAKRRGQLAGDGTPIHLTIPTPSPWVPLRILGLGKQASELIEADVFVLTDRAPSVLPLPDGFGTDGIPSAPGMRLERSEPASASLLADLHADKGMQWVPRKNMWLSFFKIDTPASKMRTDLAIDPSGGGQPSWVAAGLPHAVGVAIRPISIEQVVRPIVRQVVTRTSNEAARPALAGVGLLGLTTGALVATIRRRRPVLK